MSETTLAEAITSSAQTSHNAQLSTKIVFWYNATTQHILQGAPEHFEPIWGYQKIVCNHAHEAEMWSARLRDQDKRIAEMSDIEREGVEGPMRANLRAEIRGKLATPPDGLNERQKRLRSALLEHALKQLDHQEATARTKRESYLHVEAFEHGK